MRLFSIFGIAAVLFVVSVAVPSSLDAQTFPSNTVSLKADSGNHFNYGERSTVVWEETIKVPKAKWLRLNFEQIILGHDPDGNTSSILRITSSKDNHFQILDAGSAAQWQKTSAYFNGDTLKLELIAYPNGRLNRIKLKSAVAGEAPNLTNDRSICDSIDDRFLSTDVRVGRTVPGGCTAWLFNDQRDCMLTAGHCASSASVIEFNVPISNPDGSYNHPGPEDQYPVDPASVQLQNAGVGDDWCYFGCFPNSNTGMTAFEAQGSSFTLELPQPVQSGDVIRITGHGTTSAPVDPTLNGAQKTHTGPHNAFSGTALSYRTDTTGGNSGSPVIYENNGTAIGIHTHGGCSSGGNGANSGTGANHPDWQNAMANPQGVCRAVVELEFPNGRPNLIDPAGGTVMQVNAVTGGATPAPGTGMLHYDAGAGFVSVPMNEINPNIYEAVFPAVPCGTVVNYYVSAQSTDSETFSNPTDAPDSVFNVLSATDTEIGFEDDFESNLGWTVSGNATDGQWERGAPAGGGDRGDPPADGDGTGSCFVTDNVAGNSDVDGGNTVLTSPIFDPAAEPGQSVILSYYRWFNNSFGASPEEDIFVIEISNDGGSTWTNVETVGPTGSDVNGGWVKKTFRVNDFVAPTDQMQLRFDASDLINGSVVEAGVDGVKVERVICIAELPINARKLLTGSITGGSMDDLHDSDDVRMDFSPAATTNLNKQLVDMIVLTETDNFTPAKLGIRIESRMQGGPVGDVIQELQLYNQNTRKYETIDTRAMTNSDSSIDVLAAGDVSRFVHPINGEILGRARHSSPGFAGTPFPWVSATDQMTFLIE